MSDGDLTGPQREFLRHFWRHLQDRLYPPTLADMAMALGVSKSWANILTHQLVQKGYFAPRRRGTGRALRLVGACVVPAAGADGLRLADAVRDDPEPAPEPAPRQEEGVPC